MADSAWLLGTESAIPRRGHDGLAGHTPWWMLFKDCIRYPPFWRNSLSVEAAGCGAQIWLFCVPALGPLGHLCAECVAERRAVSANPRG